MKWRKWRLGLLVAIMTGCFTALTGLAAGITREQFLIILLVSIGKDALLFLKEHPVDTITNGDTEHRTRV
jgi:hypothetical protein